jgi:hypothetical protein
LIDIDQFQERAAIIEYCGGLSRFRAETLAAQEQGAQRWEALNALGMGHSQGSRDHRPQDQRQPANGLPRVQRASQEKDRPVPVGHVQG